MRQKSLKYKKKFIQQPKQTLPYNNTNRHQHQSKPPTHNLHPTPPFDPHKINEPTPIQNVYTNPVRSDHTKTPNQLLCTRTFPTCGPIVPFLFSGTSSFFSRAHTHTYIVYFHSSKFFICRQRSGDFWACLRKKRDENFAHTHTEEYLHQSEAFARIPRPSNEQQLQLKKMLYFHFGETLINAK